MVPILFSKTETDFTHNGIGRLVDCISCVVTEERNGIYEVELKYPLTGKWFDELIQGGIIGVIHDDNHDIQPFDLYKSDAPIDGVVTFYAHHISYRLNNIILEPFTAASASAAIAGISTHSVNTNPFSFSTDKTTVASFSLDRPASVRSILWGQEGSLLDTFGTAEFKFDKFSVSMLTARGSDTGVTVRYGKNMTGMQRVRDDSGSFSALAPFWTDGTNIVYPSEIIVQPTNAVTPVKPVSMDMSDKFQSQPTEEDIRTMAKKYLDDNEPWTIDDTITIDFIALWQTTDYESVAAIQRVGLCDTVSIYYTDMGIVAEKAKIVKVVYDVLAERFNEMQVGTVSQSYVAIETGSQQASEKAAQMPVCPMTVGTSAADIIYDASVLTTLHRTYARRIGNICIFSFVATIGSISSGTALFTLSQALRPSAQVDFLAFLSLTGGGSAARGQLLPDTGVISVPVTTTTGETVRAELVWALES